MDLASALAQTAHDKGPQSFIDRLLDELDNDADVLAALNGNVQAAHLARALTKLAHHHGVIGEASSIDGQAVRKWRAQHGPR